MMLFSLPPEIRKEDAPLSDSPHTRFICTNAIKIEPEESYLVLAVSTMSYEATSAPSDEIEGLEFKSKKKELVERFDFLWVYSKEAEQYAYKAHSVLGERIWSTSQSLPKKAIEAKYAHPTQIAIPDEKGRMVRVGAYFLSNSGSHHPLIMRGIGISREKALRILKEKDDES